MKCCHYTTQTDWFWDGDEIAAREHLTAHFAREVEAMLRGSIGTWLPASKPRRCRPANLMNPNCGDADLWTQPDTDLVLRPAHDGQLRLRTQAPRRQGVLLMASLRAGRPERAIARNRIRAVANMRLKEFWQQEFQCLFSETTKADYQTLIMEPLAVILGNARRTTARIVESDRLPDYSLKTMDVEADTGERWMEVCSVSVRKDYAESVRCWN